MPPETPATIYDKVAYPSYAHPQTHPDQLATKALLYGMSPAPIERCRVLELGCFNGTNLASIALGFPQCECIGIDLSAIAIAQGQEMTQAIGLKNVSLRVGSIMDIGADLGKFDYIIAHGLYSWVPESVRQKIMSICQTHLAPYGVACISFNAKPGGYIKQMFRDMMLFHTKNMNSPQERVHHGISLLKFVTEAQTTNESYRRLFHDEFAKQILRNPYGTFHDDLADVNEIFSLQEFCEHAQSNGLQYLCDGDYLLTDEHNLAEPVRLGARQLGKNRIAHEQYLDYLSGRSFRQTYVCRADVPLKFEFLPVMLERLHVCSLVQPVSTQLKLSSGASEKFVGKTKAQVEVSMPLAKSALVVLSEITPRSMPLKELLIQARARIGSAPSSTFTDPQTTQALDILLRLYSPGIITLHLSPPVFAKGVSKQPTASPLARWLLKLSDTLPNLLHESVPLKNPSGRHLLSLLDGTRDRAALLSEMRAFVSSQPQNSADGDVDGNLTNALNFFADNGLLMPDGF